MLVLLLNSSGVIYRRRNMRLGISKLVWKKYEDCSYIFLLVWIMVKWRSVVFYGINLLGVSLKLRDLWVDENTFVATDIFIPFNPPPQFLCMYDMCLYMVNDALMLRWYGDVGYCSRVVAYMNVLILYFLSFIFGELIHLMTCC